MEWFVLIFGGILLMRVMSTANKRLSASENLSESILMTGMDGEQGNSTHEGDVNSLDDHASHQLQQKPMMQVENLNNDGLLQEEKKQYFFTGQENRTDHIHQETVLRDEFADDHIIQDSQDDLFHEETHQHFLMEQENEMNRLHQETVLRDQLENDRFIQEEQDRLFQEETHFNEGHFGDHPEHDDFPDRNNPYIYVGTDMNTDIDYHGVVDHPLETNDDWGGDDYYDTNDDWNGGDDHW